MAVANYSSVQQGRTTTHSFPSLVTTGLLPTDRIPVELLADIFSWCRCSYKEGAFQAPPGLPSLSRVRLSESTDPQTLSQVCRYWRNVALATPRLWSSIKMIRPQRQDLATIRLWLDRSGPYPLHLSFEEGCDVEFRSVSNNPVTKDLFAILTTEVHRWKDINFHFWKIVEPSLLKLTAEALTQLKSARISSQPDDLPQRAQLWDIIHASPSFQEAGWDETYIGTMADKVPWHKLLAIHLTFFGVPRRLFQILHSCYIIVKLELQFWHTQNITSYIQPPLILPYLRDLTVYTETELDQFFDGLTLPQLHSLSIEQLIWFDTRSEHTRSHHSSLKTLLIRSRCPLQNLTYRDGYEESGTPELLASPHLSNLTELEIRSPLSDRTMLYLTHSSIDCDNNILPQLKKLTLWQYTTSPGILAAMVSSRRLKPVGAPRLVELSLLSHTKYQTDIEQLRTLAGENGLIISGVDPASQKIWAENCGYELYIGNL